MMKSYYAWDSVPKALEKVVKGNVCACCQRWDRPAVFKRKSWQFCGEWKQPEESDLCEDCAWGDANRIMGQILEQDIREKCGGGREWR